MMHGGGKSDEAVVAGKPANEVEQSVEEPVERRAEAEGNASQFNTGRMQSRETVSQGLERIRQAAREREKERFTSLLHHVSIDLLRRAFGELKRNAAPGVDGLRYRDYEADLERNLEELHARVHGGRTGRSRHGGHTYPSRTVDSVRSRLPHWRTRLSNVRSSRC
jgi:RNA-directed DNA polymerase